MDVLVVVAVSQERRSEQQRQHVACIAVRINSGSEMTVKAGALEGRPQTIRVCGYCGKKGTFPPQSPKQVGLST